MASGFLTIKIQSARFSKIRKFVPLIIFNCEPIFHVIRVLNFYCQKTRCHINTRFLLKNVGNDFWFDLCYHEAVLWKIFSQFQKNKGTISRLFQLIENFHRLFCRKIQKLEMTMHFLTNMFAWTIFSKRQPVLNA